MMSVASYPVEIIQTPKQVTIVSEAFNEVRRVFLDRPQLQIDDVPPGYYGRSVGRWDGDTLVVDTVGIKPSVQYQGMPHSDQMRITERFSLSGRFFTTRSPLRILWRWRSRSPTRWHTAVCRTTKWWSSSATTIANMWMKTASHTSRREKN